MSEQNNPAAGAPEGGAAPTPAAGAATPAAGAEGAAAAKPAEGAAAKPAEGAPADKGKEGEGKPASEPKPGEGQGKAEPKPGDKPGQGEGKDKQEGSADYSAFSVPEGFKMDEAMLAKFAPVAKSANLSQEDAQKFIDIHTESITKVVQDPEFRGAIYAQEHAGRLKTWADQVMSDQEVGGAKAEEALSLAMTAVTELDKEVPGLLALVKDAGIGFGNNLKAVKFFEKLGRKIASGGAFPNAANGNSGQPKTLGERLYPNQS